MAEVVFILCALTSSACTYFLARSYLKTRVRLLLWSSLCFLGLALNNIILFIDMYATPADLDLSLLRTVPALAGLLVLLYGLIWEST